MRVLAWGWAAGSGRGGNCLSVLGVSGVRHKASEVHQCITLGCPANA